MSLLTKKDNLGDILLIDSLGNNVGEVSFKEALRVADEDELDLVLMSRGKLPVCKVMDYSKHLYDKKKAERDSRSNSRSKLKEIRFGLNIGDHDLEVKVNNVNRNLRKGNKVKVVLTLKGREMDRVESANELLLKFKEMCGEVKVDKDIYREGRRFVIHLS